MKALSNRLDLCGYACRVERKHGLFVSLAGSSSREEYLKAAPYLKETTLWMSVEIDGFVLMLFDTAEARDHHYDLTVGDDGPTKLNPYKGKATVFAAKIDENGRVLTENT